MEMERPSWCEDRECLCLTAYDGRICVGRLPEKVRHDDMFNTHRLCLEETQFLINDADAYYLGKCMAAVRRDVEQHQLYHAGRGKTYDFGGKP